MKQFRLRLSLAVHLLVLTTFAFAGVGDTPSSKSISFDGHRVPFEQTEEGRNYKTIHGALPAIVDSSGYPHPQNTLKSQATKLKKNRPVKPLPKLILKPGPKVLPVKKNPNVTSLFFKSVLDFFISSASALDYDPLVPEIANCRPFVPLQGSEVGYFKVYFEDLVGAGTSTGYDHPTLGYDRREAVCEVLEEIASIIMLDQIVNGPKPVFVFTKTWPSGVGAALGVGSSFFGLNQTVAGSDTGTLHRHIITRADPNPNVGDFDAIVHTNWSYPFSVDSLVNPPLNGTNFDFKTVIRHEVLHAMGFMSRLPTVISSTNTTSQHNLFDESLFSPSSSYFLMSQPLSPLLQVPVGAPSAWFVNNASIYQGKKNYVGATLDGARPLYTPSTIVNGSSLSHFDMNRLASGSDASYVMHPQLPMGVARGVHSHEKEVLCHLGYQVAGMNGCTGPTPVAVNDVGVISSTSFICIPFLTNDVSHTGSVDNLRPESVQLETPSGIFAGNAVMTFHTPAGCTGVAYSSIASAELSNAQIKYLKVTTPSSVSLLRIKYRNKDIISNRISEPALISYSRCNVALDEYVCNGDFEMGGPSSFGNPSLPLWGAALGSPDLATKNAAGNHSMINLPWTTNSMTVDMVDNGNFAAFIDTSIPGGTGNINIEKITTRLKTPLTVGQCYKVSFDSTMLNLNKTYMTLPTFNMLASFSTSDMSVVVSQQPLINSVLDAAVNILDQQITLTTSGPAQWYTSTRFFAPSQAFEFLTVHTGFPTYVPQGGFGIYSWIDNVSVKKVASTYCPPNSISGFIYNDLNLSGTMNLAETVLPGVSVGLFNGLTGELVDEAISSATGEYKFHSVPALSNYYVALMSEPLFQTISEPVSSNLLNGYQYVRSVSFSNGGVVTGENFGFLLQGQTPLPPGPDNIVCANTPPATNFNTSDSSANNVPLYQCYAFISPNGARECLYNFAAPGAVGGSNTGCPVATAGTNCCGWYTACPAVTVSGVVSNASAASNGAITLAVSGTGPYTYLWSNGQTSQNLINVPAGEYSVTVKNANGCQTLATFRVHSQMQVNVTKNQGCTVALNSLTGVVTGGGPGYTYRWYRNGALYPNSTSPFSGLNPTGVPAGNYYLLATDINGQQVQSATITIDAYTAPNVVVAKTDSSAPSFTNGSIKATVTGGVAPFDFIFSGSDPLTVTAQASPYTRESMTGSNSNVYAVQVRDFKNCLSNTVLSTKVFRKLNKATTQVVRRCDGAAVNARVLITPPTGGHGPYSYKVNGSPLPAGQLFFDTTAGITSYQLMITDSSTPAAQVLTQSLSVSTIPALHSVSVATVAASAGQSNGTATVTATANLGPYTYSYTPGTEFLNVTTNTHLRTGLAAGTYSVSVKTVNGCSFSKSFTVLATTSVIKATK